MRVILYLEEIEGFPNLQLTYDDDKNDSRSLSEIDTEIRKLLAFVNRAYKDDGAPF
jgi:hypothetical protein